MFVDGSFPCFFAGGGGGAGGAIQYIQWMGKFILKTHLFKRHKPTIAFATLDVQLPIYNLLLNGR